MDTFDRTSPFAVLHELTLIGIKDELVLGIKAYIAFRNAKHGIKAPILHQS